MFVGFTTFSFRQGDGSDRPDRRLRFAMQTAILVIAALLVAAGWTIWLGEKQRSKDAELLNLAGLQRTNLLRIAADLDLPAANAMR